MTQPFVLSPPVAKSPNNSIVANNAIASNGSPSGLNNHRQDEGFLINRCDQTIQQLRKFTKKVRVSLLKADYLIVNNVRLSISLKNIRPHLLMQSLGGGGKLRSSSEATTKAAAENGGNNSSPRANSFRSCNASPSQVSYKLIVFSNWISNSSKFFNSSFLVDPMIFK